jgi:hypothetical protein
MAYKRSQRGREREKKKGKRKISAIVYIAMPMAGSTDDWLLAPIRLLHMMMMALR